MNYQSGFIDFDPEGMDRVINGSFKNYNEYLEVQKRSINSRRYLGMIYLCGYEADFKGTIDRFDERGKLLFIKIMVSGMYHDGNGFYGTEDHVWMESSPFKGYTAGDSVHFSAEIYCYMKHNNGKLIDYGLRNPMDIVKISPYDIPTEDQLIEQEISRLVCETCMYGEQCYGFCIANEEERRKQFNTLKNFDPRRFTPLTVMLAYELEYRFMLQTGMFDMNSEDPQMKKFIKICMEEPIHYIRSPEEAVSRLLYPEKPRIYINE